MAERAPVILDPNGRPIRRQGLSREVGRATATGVRQVWDTRSLAYGLTPDRLSAVLRAADIGETQDYLTLAEEMEERDPHYAAVLGVRKRAVCGIAPEVDAASDAAADVAVADALREVVGAASFPALVEDCLDALGKGFSAVEIVWRRGARWTPERYEWRDPRWFRWDLADGRTLRLLDEADSFAGVPLAPAKWIVHVPRLRSGLPARAGLARIASAAYLIKAYSLTDWTAFAEVYGMPLRLGRYGPGATEEDINTLIGAVANLGTDAAAVMPESMRVEFQQASSVAGSGARVFHDLVKYVDSQVSKAVLGQTMTTDDGSSRAQAVVHDGVRRDILQADARQLAATLERDLVTPFVKLNFGSDVAQPVLRLPVSEPEDTAALARALELLVPLGLQVQSSVVRDRFGLPDPDEGAELLAAPGAPDVSIAAAGRRRPRSRRSKAADDDDDADGPVDEIDELADAALVHWRAMVDPLIEPVEDMLDSSDDLGTARGLLPDLAAATNTDLLAETLARATFAARISASVAVSTAAQAPSKGGTINPGLPPDEAVRAFRAKGYALTHAWQDMWQQEHSAAFTVAKVADLDLLDDIRGAVDKALAEGTTFETFRSDLQPLLEERGWWGRKTVVDPKTGELVKAQLGSPRRLKTIFRTNLRMSYSAGQWERIQRTKERRPWLRYTAVLDNYTRPAHADWHGTILPVDDPWWDDHNPPNGWNCRCRVIQLSETQMRRNGWKPSGRPTVEMRDWKNKRTGETVAVPKGIDPGFAYNPGDAAARRADISRLLADRLETTFPGAGAGKIYEWDPAKRKAARRKHGVDFASMIYFDWGTAANAKTEVMDGEQRYSVLGLINGALHSATYTERDGKVRMITLRKANKREMKRYTQQRNQ